MALIPQCNHCKRTPQSNPPATFTSSKVNNGHECADCKERYNAGRRAGVSFARSTDRLATMLQSQKELQIESYAGDPALLDDEARAEFIRWNMLALEDELHEALAEVGWKPWATSRHVNREAYVGELVDAFHFLMNLLLVVGVDANEFYVRYLAKRDKNAQRQEDGYDGVAGKCPMCRRAYDDEAVECYPATGEFPGYCAGTVGQLALELTTP